MIVVGITVIRLGFLELFLNAWYEPGSAKSIDRLQYKDFIFIFNHAVFID